MPNNTVKEVADRLKLNVDEFLQTMAAAKLPQRSVGDELTTEQLQTLLAYIQQNREEVQQLSRPSGSSARTRIRLNRTTTSTLTVGGRGGKRVSVVSRKKKTYVKRAQPTVVAPAEQETEKIAAESTVLAEEEARKAALEAKEADAKKQFELEGRREREEEARSQVEQERQQKGPLAKTAEDAQRLVEKTKKHEVPLKQEAVEVDVKAEGSPKKLAGKDGKRLRTKPSRSRERPEAEAEDELEPRSYRAAPLSLRGGRRARRTQPLQSEVQGGQFEKPLEAVVKEVELTGPVVIGDLARRMSVKTADVMKTLMGLGVIASVNESIDQDTAVLVVEEMGHRVKVLVEDRMEEELKALLEIAGDKVPRAPVVTVMGHVDHGKTSLLDRIRSTRVVQGEAGGITQHIGAYNISTPHGLVTFLDTPGHAAFTAMRARGANATDIVVLVVAATDGVQPQTQEAVQHAQSADVPIVVAVNKIDMEGADPERARRELSAIGITPEDWGGETLFVNVSAETGEGIDELLHAITLQAELLELEAVPDAPARGIVIESRVDRGRGAVATILVRNGTLRHGEIVIAGQCYGKVRALLNEHGNLVKDAGPSVPVEMLGLSGMPNAGDDFSVAVDDRQARQLADSRAHKQQQSKYQQQSAMRRVTLENIILSQGNAEKRVLNIVLKADARGSLEVVMQACVDIGNEEVSVDIIGHGVGGINESDANFALINDAVIFGFNVRADNSAKMILERENIEVRYYNVIYELLDDIKTVLQDMLVPELREDILGKAEVREVFPSPRFGQIAGCMVVDGTVTRYNKVRVLRNDIVIFQGELDSLRRFKDDVPEVRTGLECGIGVRHYNDVREGDLIEVYETRAVARAL